jgi:hypothetical protein
MSKRTSNSRSYSARRVDIREVRPSFLIVCEGEKTEPFYFKSFRVPSVVLDIKGGEGDPTRLVNAANEYSQKDEYDQVWCVFDRDPGAWTAENFNNALKNAKRHKFHVAYSNESFELWYILHFQFLNTATSRIDYEDKLSKLLGQKYQKNDPKMYEKLFEKQSEAIKHAERLLESYDRSNPAKDNPSTTVHLLVQALNLAQS